MYLRRLLYISAPASDLGIKTLSYKKCCVSFASAYPPTLGCDDTAAIIIVILRHISGKPHFSNKAARSQKLHMFLFKEWHTFHYEQTTH